MTTDHSEDESDQNIAERLIDRVVRCRGRIGEAGHAIVEGVQDRVEQLTARWHREESAPGGTTDSSRRSPRAAEAACHDVAGVA